MLDLFTKSRDGLYEASAKYDDGVVTVYKKSRINNKHSEGFKPSPIVAEMRNNKDIVDANGVLKQDVVFDSLSAAACFVTGRIANGMITWKTKDGKYVRNTLKATK